MTRVLRTYDDRACRLDTTLLGPRPWCWVRPTTRRLSDVIAERPLQLGLDVRRCRHHGERYRFYLGWPFCTPHRHAFGVCSARPDEGLPGEQRHVPGCA